MTWDQPMRLAECGCLISAERELLQAVCKAHSFAMEGIRLRETAGYVRALDVPQWVVGAAFAASIEGQIQAMAESHFARDMAGAVARSDWMRLASSIREQLSDKKKESV